MSDTLRQLSQDTGLPLNEVRLLTEYVTAIPRIRWMSEPAQTVPPENLKSLHDLLTRRAAGEPVAYLLGEAGFYGRTFTVNPAVLIPRPETEELVERVLECVRQGRRSATHAFRLLDAGTGSGAIAITLALEEPGLQVHACDISEASLAIARQNARALGAAVSFSVSDWLAAYGPDEPFDLIVSNPPYIVCNDPHLLQGDLRFEPAGALTDHADGLSAYHALAVAATTHLKPGGSLWVEHGWHQQADVIRIFEQAGLMSVSGFSDLAGHARMVCAFRPAD